ncbi:MAG: DNA repair protein RecN, partial [Ruminococcaceae bacterium]|nr:DNA repair protein RecN [Oscillospiraceae bacterium]
MLKFLHIENIAVIEQTDIEFKQGFNVLTGETGAGKSIVIDSINAVLGERTSKDLIRTGCDSAIVSAVFCDIDSTTLELLSQNEISPDSDGNIIIHRKLSATGKGLIKINNIPVTASLLREISKNLINIHGQHDNQALLNSENHLSYIDAIANNYDLIDEYYQEFRSLNAIRKEIVSLQMDQDEKARKIDLLKYQINELENANIKNGEIEQLKQNLNIANDYEKTFESLSAVEYLLSGNEDNDGAITQITNGIKRLSLLGDNFEKDYTRLNEALSLIQDVRANVSSFLGNTAYLELDANEINQRLDFISRLMVKYGSSEEQMLEFLDNAKLELEKITLSDKRIIELSKLLEESKIRLVEKGKKLTDSRVK